jgi:formiminotetrahydrofolate cyclodeaminase
VLTEHSLRGFTDHIAGQGHAMAGATIAASGALACGLGEACVRISLPHLEAAGQQAAAQQVADRLSDIRGQLQSLSDEDGAAITAFAALRDAGQELAGQDRLCRMPVEMGQLSGEAAALLQDFRPLVRNVQDDLEMAITLLGGAARAARLLLDSNLRLWPEPIQLAKYEPELAALRVLAGRVQPAERVRH